MFRFHFAHNSYLPDTGKLRLKSCIAGQVAQEECFSKGFLVANVRNVHMTETDRQTDRQTETETETQREVQNNKWSVVNIKKKKKEKKKK